jgi:hypothetical protein
MSSSVVTCECGAKVRLPADAAVAAFRCPRCKTPLPKAEAVPVTSAEVVTGEEATCPICQTAIQPGEPSVKCPGCDLVHHEECWKEIGGCGTFGCSKAPAAEKGEQAATTPLTAWGDTKRCPACGETIKAIALKCRYCGSTFDTVDPLTIGDLRQQVHRDEKLKTVRNTFVGLFVVSLIGCLAPLTALIAAIYVPTHRAQLAKCGPLYKIMGWTALALSCFYSLLIVLFIAFGR